MIRLDPPKLTTAEVFQRCWAGTQEPRSSRMRRHCTSAIRAERDLLEAIANGRELSEVVVSPQRKADMIWFYENRLVASVAGKELYRDLRLAANGKCTLCGVQKARTLDHTLPKASFPRLAVTPANLVPACRDCNTDMGVASAGRLSPYFDGWTDSEPWLRATVRDVEFPDALSFFPHRPESWSDKQWEALDAHFEIIDLDGTFAIRAAGEWGDSKYQLANIYLEGGGLPAVIAEMELRATSARHNDKNSWKAATYDAWRSTANRFHWEKLVEDSRPHP